MQDVMIDIETLGTRSDAAIIQIGACYFDRKTGLIGPFFQANIALGDRINEFSVDQETILWWIGENYEARKSLISEALPFDEAIKQLCLFLKNPGNINLWSHATFDIPILMHAFEVAGVKSPVHYRNMRDIRTLMDIADHHSEKPREGIHHNALDDAKFQVEYCVEALQKLNGKKVSNHA